MRFAAYQAHTQLKLNRYGIAEPDNLDFLPAAALDLVIVPLLGFDKHGQRLGSGAGHYDRTFAFLNNLVKPSKPVLIGLAYELQAVTTLPAASWDVRLDHIITENAVYSYDLLVD